MTKKFLLTAGALAALAFAGAAQAQVITNVTVSTASRAQNAVAAVPADPAGGAAWGAIAVTPPTGAAAVADATYFLARESVYNTQNRASLGAGTTHTTARYLAAGAGANSYLGPIGGATYQVTLTLTGATFPASIPVNAFTFAYADGADATAALTGKTIVSGGAAGDSSVTLQFEVPGAVTGRTAAASIGSVKIEHPFQVAAFGNVGVSVNTAIVSANPAQPTLAGVIGTVAQRERSALISLVDGYEFSAGGVAGAAAGASAFANVNGADQILLPNYFTVSGDGIANAGFGRKAQAGANTIALRGLTGQTIPNLGYNVRVDALNGVFGTTANSLRPGDAGGTIADAGNFTVGAGNAFATSAAKVGGTTTTVYINRGTVATDATAALASTDQQYTVRITPAADVDGFVSTIDPRTFAGQTVVLQGTTIRAPWVNSSVANYNTVLRLTNHGTRAVGPIELTLAIPATAGANTSRTCRTAELSKLSSLAAGGELRLNSADFTTCFGDFGRGDLTLRILDTVPANTLSAKLRTVNPGDGTVTEQSLGL